MNCNNIFVTVFTPTYNRANTIDRVYKSLVHQTYNFFEWVIIDDGSTDNTEGIIKQFICENRIVINYIKKENHGKMAAIIDAVKISRGDMFLIADSDDEFKYDAIEIFLKTYNNIPHNLKENISGVSGLCCYAHNGKIVGNFFPKSPMLSNSIELDYKYKIYGEKWGIIRTKVLKKYLPFNFAEDVKFISENYLWYQIANDYKTIYINEVLRTYYTNSQNSLSCPFTTIRHPNGVFMSEEMQLICSEKYWGYNLKKFAVNMIKLSYAAQESNISIGKVLNNKKNKLRLLIIFFWPIGHLMKLTRKLQFKYYDKNKL